MRTVPGKTKDERPKTKGRAGTASEAPPFQAVDNSPGRSPVPRGFTLVEMLTVIFIIITLLGLLGAAIVSAERFSKKKAIEACLASISAAVETYYNDFSAYPVSDPAAADTPNCSFGGSITNGSAGLAEALMGYLDNGLDGAGPANGDPAYGFRTPVAGKGRIYGPYMAVTSTTYSAASTTDQYFMDPLGQRILYYRANASLTVVAGTTNYFSNTVGAGVFNVTDNSNSLFNPVATPTLQGYVDPSAGSAQAVAFLPLIGDTNGNNKIDGSETPLNKTTFLLVSPGPDGNYFDGNNITNTK